MPHPLGGESSDPPGLPGQLPGQCGVHISHTTCTRRLIVAIVSHCTTRRELAREGYGYGMEHGGMGATSTRRVDTRVAVGARRTPRTLLSGQWARA